MWLFSCYNVKVSHFFPPWILSRGLTVFWVTIYPALMQLRWCNWHPWSLFEASPADQWETAQHELCLFYSSYATCYLVYNLIVTFFPWIAEVVTIVVIFLKFNFRSMTTSFNTSLQSAGDRVTVIDDSDEEWWRVSWTTSLFFFFFSSLSSFPERC